MSNDVYSGLKALRHLDIVNQVKMGIPARPAHVQIVLSDLCQQACNFCAYRDPGYTSSQRFHVPDGGHKGEGSGRKGLIKLGRNYNPNRMIPVDKALEIINDCARMGVSAVQLTGGGEPTLHPDFSVVCDALVRHGIPYSVVTNGALVVRRGLVDDLARSAWCRFSVDAGTPETYSKIRNVKPNQFDAVWSAVYDVRNQRGVAGSNTVIGVGFVITEDNWTEVYHAAKLAKDAGADNIRIGAQFSSEGASRFEGFASQCAALCKEAEELADEDFQVYSRFNEKLAELESGSPDYEDCGYQYFTTYIGADLNVYRCCVYAYNDRGLLGSLENQSFGELWMSYDRLTNMNAFNARNCDRCQFNKINRTIDYVLSPESPLHSEFV